MDSSIKFSIHGFCDASIKAYAAVIYTVVNIDENNIVTLLTSKTKVAPLKNPLTLPRLELSAAHLLAKMINTTKDTLKIPYINIFAWSDSTITLSWVNKPPSNWKAFVAAWTNQKSYRFKYWAIRADTRYPAECASRGLFPNDLINYDLWWKGPHWLLEDRIKWPKQIIIETKDEKRTTKVLQLKIIDRQILNKYSNYMKLI